MKRKLSIIFSVLLGLVACTNGEFQEAVINGGIPQTRQFDPNRRSYAEAVEIAQNSIKMLEDDKAVTRGAAPARRLNLKDGVKAFCKASTRTDSSKTENDTLLYVFNFTDNQGFAVVSATRHFDGLIAVVEEGSYDPSVPTGNPGFDTYMNMAKAYVAYKDKVEAGNGPESIRGVSENPIVKAVYDTIYYQNIAPKVTVRWGQDYRMGQYCPNYYCGCANTAAAQIMSYYKYPYGRTLTFAERDQSYTVFSWSNMCNRTYADHLYNWDDYDKQIGRLARQLGEDSGSTYHTDGTGTSTNISNLRNTMISWGYSAENITTYDYSDADGGYQIGNYLAIDKLIYMRGANSDGEKHGWIIDGCKYVKCLYRLMVSYDGGINWSVFQELDTYRTCHNHINWGWRGQGNGYFHSWILNAYNEIQYDDQAPASGYNNSFYNNVQYFAVWH